MYPLLELLGRLRHPTMYLSVSSDSTRINHLDAVAIHLSPVVGPEGHTVQRNIIQ